MESYLKLQTTPGSIIIKMPSIEYPKGLSMTDQYLQTIQNFLNVVKTNKKRMIKFSGRSKHKHLYRVCRMVHPTYTDFFNEILKTKTVLYCEGTIREDVLQDSSLPYQLFGYDLTNNSITLYAFNSCTVEVGHIHVSHIFDNWGQLFYPDVEKEKSSIVLDTLSDILDTSDTMSMEMGTLDMVRGLVESISPVKKPDDGRTRHDAPSFREVPKSDKELILMSDDYFGYDGCTLTMFPVNEIYTEKMKESLDPVFFKLWDTLFNSEARDLFDEVVISYSGSGDDGSLDDVTFFKEGKICLNDTILDNNTGSAITTNDFENLVDDIINQYESGYYNNDGGYGELTLTRSTFKYDHFNYETRSDHTQSIEINADDSDTYVRDIVLDSSTLTEFAKSSS